MNIPSSIILSSLATVLAGLTACSPPEGSVSVGKQLTVADVAGVWVADYDGKTLMDHSNGGGRETLLLNADGTFRQSFDDGLGFSYSSDLGTWNLVLEGDTYYVHLKSAMFFGAGSAKLQTQYPLVTLEVQRSSPVPFSKIGSKLVLTFRDPTLGIFFDRVVSRGATLTNDKTEK